MTAHTAATPRASGHGLLARFRRWQQQFSDRVHAAGDEFARQHGWQVTPVTGRAGFGGRIYRDPRFSQLAAARTAQSTAAVPTRIQAGRRETGDRSCR